jgi:AI-2 transport protein TqsA
MKSLADGHDLGQLKSAGVKLSSTIGSTEPKEPASSPITDILVDSERRELIQFQRRLNLIAAVAIILVALVYLLQQFSTVLQQLLVSLFLIYLLMPIHHWLLRKGLPPWLSCGLIVGGILIAFAGVGLLVGSSFQDLETKLPQYQKTLARLIPDTPLLPPSQGLVEPDAINRAEQVVLEHGTELAKAGLHALSGFLSEAFLVLVYLGFMLAERASVVPRLEKALAPEHARQVQDVMHRINSSITEYMVVKTSMGLLAGVVTAALLLAFGVDYAVLWGILAFLFNYIPYLGSIVATVVPVLLSFVQFEDPLRTLVILVVLLVLQNGIGYLLEPRLAGKRLDLSPLVIIVSLAFWGSLWGIVGMILAVPLVVVIKTILANTVATRPLAKMLSNG